MAARDPEDDLEHDDDDEDDDHDVLDQPLSPQLVAAFETAQAEYKRVGRDQFALWKPAALELTHARMFFLAFEPEILTLENFRGWYPRMDQLHRNVLLRLKPTDHDPDKLILVKPSTGLRKPFWSVIKGNEYFDQILALLGLTREQFMNPGESPTISEGRLEEVAPRIVELFELVRHYLGIEVGLLN